MYRDAGAHSVVIGKQHSSYGADGYLQFRYSIHAVGP